MAADQMMSKEEDLPDTLTGSTPVDSGANVPVRMPWGRLISHKSFLKSVDLVQPFIFGRSEDCSITINSGNCTSNRFLVSLSKKHFQIEKSPEDNLIYITDYSKNGTFVNKKKLGKFKKRILKSEDEIAVSFASNVVYKFFCQGSESTDNFLPPQFIERFVNIRALGQGSCGEVRLVKDRESFQYYAVKKILLSESNSSLIHKINHPSKVFNEITILRTLSHPCIISMSDLLQFDREVYIVLEYMAGGELTKRVLNEPMTDDIAKFYFMQMVFATQYLHSQGIIHRDLKPENILLLDDREETLLKITDFGLSKITDINDATTMCGTLRFVAPEVLNIRHYGEYGKEVDIWSLAVILYFMVSRDYPFKGEDNYVIARNIVKGQYSLTGGVWSGVEKNLLKDLLKKMLQLMPKNRITVQQILEHEWISTENGVKYRIKRLFGDLEPPLKDLSLEPSFKRYKLGTTSGSSDELTSNGSSNYSHSSLICC